jgi:hypothetical protein
LLRSLAAAVALALLLPAAVRANGDPASDYLLFQRLFLPFGAKIDKDAVKRLEAVLADAERADFPIRVAVISNRADLGTAFSLYNKPQRYAEFLGLELSFQYKQRLLVVMPEGYGYSRNGYPEKNALPILAPLPAPGKNPTKEVEGAAVAVRRLAVASGVQIKARPPGGSDSEARDRIVIAASAASAAALLAGGMWYRRRRRTLNA